jgi:hypothetical protein
MTAILLWLLLIVGVGLFLYAACQYGKPAEITCLGVYLSDGTRIDRPYQMAYVPVHRSITINAGRNSVVTISSRRQQ